LRKKDDKFLSKFDNILVTNIALNPNPNPRVVPGSAKPLKLEKILSAENMALYEDKDINSTFLSNHYPVVASFNIEIFGFNNVKDIDWSKFTQKKNL